MNKKTSRRAGRQASESGCCDDEACCPPLAGLLEPRLFKALGDPTRQALVIGMSQCCRPCSVSEISTCCDIDFSVVSRHLATLEQAGILESHKSGRTVFYQLRFQEISSRLRVLADALEGCARAREQSAACSGVCCCPREEARPTDRHDERS